MGPATLTYQTAERLLPGPHGPIAGPHNPLMLKYLELINVYAKEHKLVNINTPANMAMLCGYELVNLPTAEAGSTAAQFRKMIYGGMKLPHLHSGDNIYLLDDKQWADFSATVLTGIKDKLNATQKVTFDQLADLAAGTQTL